jgi:Zn-dependent protease with chaperone function
MAKVLILAAALALAACQTTSGSFCQVSSPIRLSAETVDHLSDQEVAAILAHNEKGAALCRWKP